MIFCEKQGIIINGWFRKGVKQMERKESFEIAALTDIAVHLAWAQVEAFADDVEKIQVLAAGDEASVRDLHIGVQEDTLTVEQPQYTLNLNIKESRWLQVCVRIPHAWREKVHINTIGGMINARGLCGNRIVLDSISGDLRANKLDAETLSLKTISGDIRVENVRADVLTARTVGGNIALNGMTAQNVKTTSVSGEQALHFAAAFENAELRSVSGDVVLTAPIARVNATMRSVSGRMSTEGVTLVEETDVPTLRATGVSADMKVISIQEQREE